MSFYGASVTQLLREWRQGDATAIDRLTPLIYAELRAVAAGLLRHERNSHTMQPTELVHEAYLKLVQEGKEGFPTGPIFWRSLRGTCARSWWTTRESDGG